MGIWRRIFGGSRSSTPPEPAQPKPAEPESRPKAVKLVVRQPTGAALDPHPAEVPSVILACEMCGFDYVVTKVSIGEGRDGVLWECSCGIRYLPPGGQESYGLVRP